MNYATFSVVRSIDGTVISVEDSWFDAAAVQTHFQRLWKQALVIVRNPIPNA